MVKKLSSLLVSDNVVSIEKMEEALQRQVIFGGRLGTNLLEMGVIDEHELNHYLSRARDLPAASAELYTAFEPSALKLLDIDTIEHLGVLPVRLSDGGADAIVTDGLDEQQLARLQTRTGYAIQQHITPDFRFQQALQRFFERTCSNRVLRLIERFPQTMHTGQHSSPPTPTTLEEPMNAAHRRSTRSSTRPPLGLGWTLEEMSTYLQDCYVRDVILTALLGFAGAFAPRRMLLVVLRHRLQGYAADGQNVPSKDLLRRARLAIQPEGSIERVCRGDTYYQGTPKEGELHELYDTLNLPAPANCLLLPIPVGPRAALVLLLDHDAYTFSASTLEPLFMVINDASEALERIIRLTKNGQLPPEELRLPPLPARFQPQAQRAETPDVTPDQVATRPALSPINTAETPPEDDIDTGHLVAAIADAIALNNDSPAPDNDPHQLSDAYEDTSANPTEATAQILEVGRLQMPSIDEDGVESSPAIEAPDIVSMPVAAFEASSQDSHADHRDPDDDDDDTHNKRPTLTEIPRINLSEQEPASNEPPQQANPAPNAEEVAELSSPDIAIEAPSDTHEAASPTEPTTSSARALPKEREDYIEEEQAPGPVLKLEPTTVENEDGEQSLYFDFAAADSQNTVQHHVDDEAQRAGDDGQSDHSTVTGGASHTEDTSEGDTEADVGGDDADVGGDDADVGGDDADVEAEGALVEDNDLVEDDDLADIEDDDLADIEEHDDADIEDEEHDDADIDVDVDVEHEDDAEDDADVEDDKLAEDAEDDADIEDEELAEDKDLHDERAESVDDDSDARARHDDDAQLDETSDPREAPPAQAMEPHTDNGGDDLTNIADEEDAADTSAAVEDSALDEQEQAFDPLNDDEEIPRVDLSANLLPQIEPPLMSLTEGELESWSAIAKVTSAEIGEDHDDEKSEEALESEIQALAAELAASQDKQAPGDAAADHSSVPEPRGDAPPQDAPEDDDPQPPVTLTPEEQGTTSAAPEQNEPDVAQAPAYDASPQGVAPSDDAGASPDDADQAAPTAQDAALQSSDDDRDSGSDVEDAVDIQDIVLEPLDDGLEETVAQDEDHDDAQRSAPDALMDTSAIELEILSEEDPDYDSNAIKEAEEHPNLAPETERALERWRPIVAKLFEHNAATRAEGREELLASHGEALPALLERFPGPLNVDRYGYSVAHMPPINTHGPLLEVLLEMGDLVAPALSSLLDVSSIEVRFYATFFFSRMRYAPIIPKMVERLFDKDNVIRQVARMILRSYRHTEGFNQVFNDLRRVLSQGDTWHIEQAAQASGALAEPLMIPALIELTNHPQRRVAEVAQRALQTLSFENFGNNTRRWQRWWERNASQERSAWLVNALNHSNREIRVMAAQELRQHAGLLVNYSPDSPRRDRVRAQAVVAQYFQTL